mgnify:FL=1
MSDHVSKILEQWVNHRPDLDCSPMGVIGRIERMSKFLAPAIESLVHSFDLSRIEFDILATLRRSSGPLTPTQLYQDTMLSSGAMSTRLEHLVNKGWIKREPSPSDRRSCTVELTQTGRENIDAIVTQHVNNERDLLQSLSLEEQEQLASLLAKWLSHHESK